MKKPKVLVTRRWPEAVEAKIAEQYEARFNESDKPMSAAEFQTALREFDAILPTVTDKLGADVFSTDGIRTKILANYGVGYSHIDIVSAKKNKIVVTNTPEVLSECTADIAMTLLLMAARRAGEGEREIRKESWNGWRPTHMVGHKVSGKTLGIIGFGRIGQEMARRAHFGFDMKILVQNRSQVKQEILDKFNAEQVDTVEELLPKSDFVSLHCPGGAENRHLINSARLDLMKPTGILINTARGEVVDEQSLAYSLAYETIAAAGLDVFESEPKINPMLESLDNVVMLPHLGSATKETREEMGFRALQNLDAFFAGQTPQDQVA